MISPPGVRGTPRSWSDIIPGIATNTKEEDQAKWGMFTSGKFDGCESLHSHLDSYLVEISRLINKIMLEQCKY